MNAKIILTTAVLLTFAGIANASPGYGPDEDSPTFKELDTNGDGKISKEERAAARTRHFQQFDADGNARMSLEEFKAGLEKLREQRLQRQFQAMDSNGDGAVTQEEFLTKKGAMEERDHRGRR